MDAPSQRVETVETGSIPPEGGKGKRRLLVLKALSLLALLLVIVYGMFNGGLYFEEEWLPVAAGILGFAAFTLLVRGYYENVPKVGWILISLLGALVLIKGLSLVWTVSEALTIRELLRSAMYLAVFAITLAAVSYRSQVEPLIDGAILFAITPVAGYGLFQKINPVRFPLNSRDPDRINSTLEYANTLALVAGLGVTLGLSRLGSLRSPLARAAYAAILVCLCVALFFTFSRGGFVALGFGLAVFFLLTSDRLQGLVNLLLLSAPLAWLVYRTRAHEALYRSGPISEQARLAAGGELLADLLVAAAVAAALQAAYALVSRRYGVDRGTRRIAGLGALASVAVLCGLGAYVVLGALSGAGGAGALFERESGAANVQERLTTLDSLRYTYWEVGLEAWAERPFTGTGAGTFEYTWLEERPVSTGVKQIHNLYLEQGTETGIFAFAALLGFSALLLVYVSAAALRTPGGGPGERGSARRTLLAGLASTVAVYLFSSGLEWHWYIPASTLIFFLLAGLAVKYASFRPPGTKVPGFPDKLGGHEDYRSHESFGERSERSEIPESSEGGPRRYEGYGSLRKQRS